MRVSADTDDGAGVGLDTLLADLIADIPARGAMLYTPDVPFDSPAGIWRTVGLPDETLRDYMANFKDLDPWAKAATTAVAPSTGAVLNTDTLVDPHGLAGAPVNGDYLRRYGIARCLVAVVEDGRSGTLPRTRLSLIRGPSEPQFTPAEAERLGQLMRVTRSFIRLSKSRDALARADTLRQSTLDLVRMPLMLVDAERRLLLSNNAASDALRSNGPLVTSNGRLQARDPSVDREVAAAVRRAAAAPLEIRFVRLGPGRPARGAPALIVSALSREGRPECEATVMLRVLGAQPMPEDGETVLRQLLGLTPAESAVALGLAEGLSHDEIARRRGVQVTTVRTVLRRLQEKLGIAKSGPLARFILSLTAVGGLRL